jgi:hypothetical protein
MDIDEISVNVIYYSLLVTTSNWWGSAPIRPPPSLLVPHLHHTCSLARRASSHVRLHGSFDKSSSNEMHTGASTLACDATASRIPRERRQSVHSLDVKLSSHAPSSGRAAGKRLLATDLRLGGISLSSSRVLIAAFLLAVGSADFLFGGRPLARLTTLQSVSLDGPLYPAPVVWMLRL